MAQTQASDSGKYAQEKPASCKFCYFWHGKQYGCGLRSCYYLLPEEKPQSTETTGCHNCSYGKPATQTIAAYVGALQEAYMFYEIKRFDVKGKAELKTLAKYYIVDTGLRNYLLGYRDVDTGHIIENIVYFELLRRGFDVAVGKVGDKEIDFIATKDDLKIYYQVTDDFTAESTRERELAPLMAVRDNYEKVVLAMNTNSTTSIEGIKIVRLIDFLLE